MPWLAKDSVFHKLAEIGEVSNLSKEDRIKYDSALRHFRDTLNVMRGAEMKGFEQGQAKGFEQGQAKGVEKGRAEGHAEGVISVAKKLKALGMPVHQIAQATGLSVSEIKEL